MLFDSPAYFIFLVAVVFLYWRLNWRRQNALLLCASYFFYGWWDWRFLLLMTASTAIDFSIGQAISTSTDQHKRRRLLQFSLLINFAILGVFKYCNFFVDSAERLATMVGMHMIPHALFTIILPPAI